MTPHRIVLGTAGHIDHGKTALVRALTGVDTDRLPEEKARGITIDLGFAELAGSTDPATELAIGVVDVPGHEDFIRTMVAGATGIDVVLLVVAADEGVMPQTREHVDIVRLLGVPEMVVAITKTDLVEPEWLALVRDDVRALLADTPYREAPVIATSIRPAGPTSAGMDPPDAPVRSPGVDLSNTGLTDLLDALTRAGARTRRRNDDDLFRLPVDRAFTIQGTGTVVTGTLWSGRVRTGETVRIEPGGIEARVRTLQVHGRGVGEARSGQRTAVALTGVGKEQVGRGSVLLKEPRWTPSTMLTVRVDLLEARNTGAGVHGRRGNSWEGSAQGWAQGLAQGQRVRVHLGTAEVLARCALLVPERSPQSTDSGHLGAGERGWVQLRLEEPAVARARDRIVLRSYSPLTTIGGGVVAEPAPPKRGGRAPVGNALLGVLDALVADAEPAPSSSVERAMAAALTLGGWQGVPVDQLPIRTGHPPSDIHELLDRGRGPGTDTGDERVSVPHIRGTAFSPAVVLEAADAMRAELERGHRQHPLRSVVALDVLRDGVPGWAHEALADLALAHLSTAGEIETAPGGARRPGFVPEPTQDQERSLANLTELYHEAGLAPPFLADLPEELRARADLPELFRYLEGQGILRAIEADLWVDTSALREAEHAVAQHLSGRSDLGPADFRDALPVSRRYLMPVLAYLDGVGVTIRRGSTRDVPDRR